MKNYAFKTKKAEIVSAARFPKKTRIYTVSGLRNSNVIISGDNYF